MNILRISSSIKGKQGLSYQLGDAILNQVRQIYTRPKVVERNLAENEIPHFNQEHYRSFNTPPEVHSTKHKDARLYSDHAVKELFEADVLLIEAPMYNFAIPSTLKSWFDHITRAGITFRYTDSGVEGLVKNKKALLAIASGGIYSQGPLKDYDFTEKYLSLMLNFIGITDIQTFRVEGSAIPEMRDTALSLAFNQIKSLVL